MPGRSLSPPSREIACHILLPRGVERCETVTLNGKPVDYTLSNVSESVYVDFSYTRDGIPIPRKEWPEQTPDVITVSLPK